MLTLARIGRLWRNARYRQLMRDILAGRPEAGLQLDERLGGPLAAAALSLLRLAELNQAGSPAAAPLATEMRQRILLSQNADGSWGDEDHRSVLTALCVRALAALSQPSTPVAFGMTLHLGDRRRGDRALSAAADRGVAWLAGAQEPSGGWGDDALATGFILLQLGRHVGFNARARLEAAMSFVEERARWRGQPPQVAQLWSRVRMRCSARLRLASAGHGRPARTQRIFFADVA